jgi:hypothetical protein
MLPSSPSFAGLPDEELIEAHRRWLAYGAELQAEMARRLRTGAERREAVERATHEQQLLTATEYASETGIARTTPTRWRAALGLPPKMTRAQWAEARAKYKESRDERHRVD